MNSKTPDLDEGVHAGLDEGTYLALPYASQSRLRTLARHSPKRMRYEMAHPGDSTDAQILGSAIDVAVLEPDLLDSRYAVAHQCEAFTKGGDRCKNIGAARYDGEHWFCNVKSHPPTGILRDDITALSPADWNTCVDLRDLCRVHPAAQRLLAGERKKLVAIWIDPETGVKCKAEFDVLDDTETFITDLKSTLDASDEGFRREIDRWKYHWQGGFYVQGANILGFSVEHYAIVAAEKGTPVDVNCFELSGEALDAGWKELRVALKRWAWCQEEGEWPGYDLGVKEISLPPWAWKQIEERVSKAEAAEELEVA